MRNTNYNKVRLNCTQEICIIISALTLFKLQTFRYTYILSLMITICIIGKRLYKLLKIPYLESLPFLYLLLFSVLTNTNNQVDLILLAVNTNLFLIVFIFI